MRNGKNIFDQFGETAKGVCRLANEWRDTALYVGGGAVAVGHALSTGNMNGVDIFLKVCAYRETVRVLANVPGFSGDLVIAGSNNEKPPSKFKLGMAGAAASAGIFFLETFLKANVAPDVATAATNVFISSLELGGCFICAAFAGGPLGVLKSYNYLWDWPRRNGRGDGGGMTQTQKLNNWVRETLRLPARNASLVPVRVPGRHRKASAQLAA